MLRYSVLFVAFLAPSLAHEPYAVRFQWKYINYTWPSEETYSAAKSNGSYIEKNNIISGIRLWKDKMYLTVPRYKNGVPASLTVTSAEAQNNITAPLLEPYPSWEMQEIGNCSALQNVMNVEIDPKGRMWILDNGRVATMTLEPQTKCPPKLVILDLENSGKVLRSYDFPNDVVSSTTGNLRNIVIDHEHGGMAYITDSDEQNPGLIVYSLANNTSWKVYHESMKYFSDAVGFTMFDNFNFSDKVNIDGIALTPPSNETSDRQVYFSPLSSFNIFAVKTQALIDAKDKEGDERKKEIEKHILILGRKPSQSGGMAMSNTGKLYFGLLSDDAIEMWDSKSISSFTVGQRIISGDHRLMQWPSNFAFDDKGASWCIANRMHLYVADQIDIEQFNYRLIKSDVNMRSYQYYPDGGAPEWPDVSAGSFVVPRFGK